MSFYEKNPHNLETQTKPAHRFHVGVLDASLLQFASGVVLKISWAHDFFLLAYVGMMFGQITTIPKPELRVYSLAKPPICGDQ